MEQSELRNLLLGTAFQPKVKDIPTPKLLLDAGVPDETLRLVSMSANARAAIFADSAQSPMLNSAMLVAKTLRLRDSGGDDGRGTHVFGKLNDQGVSVMDPLAAQTLLEQDSALIDALGSNLVIPFLGLDTKAVEDAKNGLKATLPNAGGTASPSTSDSPPSGSVETPSEIPTS